MGEQLSTVQRADRLLHGRDITVDIGSAALSEKVFEVPGEQLMLVRGFPSPYAWLDVAFDDPGAKRQRLYPARVIVRPFKRFYLWSSGGTSLVAKQITLNVGATPGGQVIGSVETPMYVRERVSNLALKSRATVLNGAVATNISNSDVCLDYFQMNFVVHGPGQVHISINGIANASALEVAADPTKVQTLSPIMGDLVSFFNDSGQDCLLYWELVGYSL